MTDNQKTISMKLKDISNHSFKAIRERLYRQSFVLYHPESAVNRSLSTTSQFCEAVVNCGYLTREQMIHAAVIYRLGGSRSGGVIYWQIDHTGWLHDGKIMYYRPDCHRNKKRNPTWVSYLLAKRDSRGNGEHESSHCLFGLHLMREEGLLPGTSGGKSVCIVEAEKTAVILSEHYPENIWLAAGGLFELQPKKFKPLRGRKVVLFPDTDPEHLAFSRWSEIANEVMQSDFWEDSPPIRVSAILERHATPEQKALKIDLIDYLFPPKPKT